MASRMFRNLGLLSILLVSCLLPSGAAYAQTRRVDLQLLVVSLGAADGASAMIKAALDENLVPYTELDLTKVGRPLISDSFLIDTTQPSVRRGRYQAVILPNEAPAGMSPVEKEALVRYELEFKIRQLDTYVYPSPLVGLSTPVQGGPLDGALATVTAIGKAGAFSYLQGEVPFEDLDPAISETYGYPSTPLMLPTGATYTPYVEATLPGTNVRGAILGVYAAGGREEMVLSASVNVYQTPQKLLFPGILNWLTHGVHLGLQRLSYSVHVDDVMRESGRWSDSLHCTLNENCNGQTGRRILMTQEDVDALVAWQDRQGMKLDLAFHAGPYVERLDDTVTRALGSRLLINRRLLRWINHTYNREFMDCTPDATGNCAIDFTGQKAWIPAAVIRDSIARNSSFAVTSQLSLDPSELITGDHTGLRRPGSDLGDNPNLLSVLGDLRIAWVGSNASAEREQRVLVGETRTVPRYPTNLFYNVATKAEEIQVYNWVYTSRLDGGSGSCDAVGNCLKRVNAQNGFDTVIAAREARIMLMHVLSNDPRPHYVHQAALTEDRLLYPVADNVLGQVRRFFNASAPVGNPTMKEAGTELKNRAAYQRARTRVTGYVQNGELVLTAQAGDTPSVPVPVTAATTSTTLASYWGVRNGWQEVSSGRNLQLPLAASVPYGR